MVNRRRVRRRPTRTSGHHRNAISYRLGTFSSLSSITELYGDEFLHTWWATVQAHIALWNNGVYHRHITPSNLAYYRDKKKKATGVLQDFDLASTSHDPAGTERMGMIPFMSFDLLKDDALTRKVKHLYNHDAESFIWVLTWISLRYSNGTLLSGKRPLEEWARADAVTCRRKKSWFLFGCRSLLENEDYPPGEGHKRNLKIARNCLRALYRALAREDWETEKPETVFKTLFGRCARVSMGG